MRQDIGQISTWKVFLSKNKFINEILTDFWKTVETGVDPFLMYTKNELQTISANMQPILQTSTGVE